MNYDEPKHMPKMFLKKPREERAKKDDNWKQQAGAMEQRLWSQQT